MCDNKNNPDVPKVKLDIDKVKDSIAKDPPVSEYDKFNKMSDEELLGYLDHYNTKEEEQGLDDSAKRDKELIIKILRERKIKV